MFNPQLDPLPDTTPVPLDQCTGCNWTIGEGTSEKPFLFCNAPVSRETKPRWCDAHSRIGLVPVKVTLRGKGRRE